MPLAQARSKVDVEAAHRDLGLRVGRQVRARERMRGDIAGSSVSVGDARPRPRFVTGKQLPRSLPDQLDSIAIPEHLHEAEVVESSHSFTVVLKKPTEGSPAGAPPQHHQARTIAAAPVAMHRLKLGRLSNGAT